MDVRIPFVVLILLLALGIGLALYNTSQVPNEENQSTETEIENNDFDNDTLSNSYEEKIGTSPYTADTDGDGLLDNWEVQNNSSIKSIPGSDPLRKDIYLQVNYGENVTHLTESEIKQLKYFWSEMDVNNPDGTKGITLFVNDSPPGGGEISETFKIEGYGVKSISYNDLKNLSKEYYGGKGSNERAISQDRRCAYHKMILLESKFPYNEDEGYAYTLGKGMPGGKFSVVMGDSESGSVMIGPKSPSRLDIMTHELLHNIAGGYHTNTTSWLAPTTPMMEPRLSNRTISKLETQGFVTNSCS